MISKYTNDEYLYKDIGLGEDTVLWNLAHLSPGQAQQFKSQIARWIKNPKIKKIFLFDHEGFWYEPFIGLDDKIHCWDSTIFDHPRFHSYFFWINWVKEVDGYVNASKNLTPWQDKNCNQMFDALLGIKRPNRIFVREHALSHAESSKFLVGDFNNSCGWSSSPDTWISGGEFETGNWKINYWQNCNVNISCIIPYNVYNNTWYSLVTETMPRLGPFLTEKTVKPILSKRLFIIFGCKHHLKMLKSAGYQTFSSIIDESYDDIDDDQLRYQKAWDQVCYLLTLDPKKVYESIANIVEYNYNLTMHTNWKENFYNEVRQLAKN